MTDIIQLGNEGVKIIINVKDANGAAVDLSSATNLKIKIKSVLATAGKTFNASLEGVGTDGAISCILGAFKGHTQPVDLFYVEGNLA